MRRKVSNLDFGLVWGKVSRWPDKEWADLVALRTAADAAKAEDKPVRKARKPKPIADSPTATDAVGKKVRLRTAEGWPMGAKPEGGAS